MNAAFGLYNHLRGYCRPLLSTTIYNPNGTIQSMTYGNGSTKRSTYDAFNRVTGVKVDNDTKNRYTYEYNANGQVGHVTDKRLGRTMHSEYDLSNRPLRIKTHEGYNHLYTGEVSYDVFGNLMTFDEKVGIGYTPYKTTFGYDEKGNLLSVKDLSGLKSGAHRYFLMFRTSLRFFSMHSNT